MILDPYNHLKWSKLTSTFSTFDPNFSYDSLLWNLLSENVKNPHIENQIELFHTDWFSVFSLQGKDFLPEASRYFFDFVIKMQWNHAKHYFNP